MTSDTVVLRPETRLDPITDDSVDAAVERLSAEFADRVSPPFVRRIVQTCRADLSGVPAGAIPELVERLARHRLTSV